MSGPRPIEEHIKNNAALIQLWQEGRSCGEIGRALDMTRGAVIGRVSRLREKGVEMREGAGQASDPFQSVLSSVDPIVFPESAATVPLATTWTEERTAELSLLYEKGEGPVAIARIMHLTYSIVDRKIRRMRDAGVLAERPICRKVRTVPTVIAAKPVKKTGFKFGVGTMQQAETNRRNGWTILAAFEAKETGKGLRLMDLTSRFQCRAPMGGEGENMLFCAEPITDGQSSYCTTCRPRFVLGTVDAKDLMRSIRKAYA